MCSAVLSSVGASNKIKSLHFISDYVLAKSLCSLYRPTLLLSIINIFYLFFMKLLFLKYGLDLHDGSVDKGTYFTDVATQT